LPSHLSLEKQRSTACAPYPGIRRREPSFLEQNIILRIKRAKLFLFLRHHRHELFDDAFQEELATLYAPSLRGQSPIPPAQLALATILQAYTGVSDDEVIEATLMDRRWQLVLDCLDTDQAPFSKGTLVAFRQRLINGQMDRRLIERTIALASQTQAFGARTLRAALDRDGSGCDSFVEHTALGVAISGRSFHCSRLQ
jgi:transposase